MGNLNGYRTRDIRHHFRSLFSDNIVAENGTIEILNASFIADEPLIFGKLNADYIEKEIKWYNSRALNINAMEEPIPQIWKDICGENGEINSNYGWCVFSEENGYQFRNVIRILLDDKYSRQAIMIYNRPSMHKDCKAHGMRDFICTMSAHLMIRDNKLHYIVSMRSNDAVFGYKNDRAWHSCIFETAINILQHKYPRLEKGNLFWNANTLHVYPRHFHLLGKNND